MNGNKYNNICIIYVNWLSRHIVQYLPIGKTQYY